jgi:hypothetical protein
MHQTRAGARVRSTGRCGSAITPARAAAQASRPSGTPPPVSPHAVQTSRRPGGGDGVHHDASLRNRPGPPAGFLHMFCTCSASVLRTGGSNGPANSPPRRPASPGTYVTVLLPRRSTRPRLGRLLPGRTAGVVSQIPRSEAMIIPFDVTARVEMLHEHQPGPNGRRSSARRASSSEQRPGGAASGSHLMASAALLSASLLSASPRRCRPPGMWVVGRIRLPRGGGRNPGTRLGTATLLNCCGPFR